MISCLLAAAFTFTAVATGVEKGAPIEFIFAGKDTDHDYESMFLLDRPIDEFCREIEKAGIPRGKPADAALCRLWPVGCKVSIEPSIDKFVNLRLLDGAQPPVPIYTGGTRLANGRPAAQTKSPFALFATYSLAQAPIVFNGIYNQGDVYGNFTVKETLKKGARYSFKISWEKATNPKSLNLTAKPGQALDLLKSIKDASENGEVDVQVKFDGALTVGEATAVANALAEIDSVKIKINGCADGNLFYRAFMPLVKWTDRKERLTQPFELTIGEADKLLFIEEDWKVDGIDPKLTPKEISFDDAANHPKVDTCFIYAQKSDTIDRILQSINRLKGTKIRNWYIFAL